MVEINIDSCVGFMEMVYERITRTIRLDDGAIIGYCIEIGWIADDV